MSIFNTKVNLPAYFYIGERLNNKVYWDYYDCLDDKLSPDYITEYSKKLIKKRKIIKKIFAVFKTNFLL